MPPDAPARAAARPPVRHRRRSATEHTCRHALLLRVGGLARRRRARRGGGLGRVRSLRRACCIGRVCDGDLGKTADAAPRCAGRRALVHARASSCGGRRRLLRCGPGHRRGSGRRRLEDGGRLAAARLLVRGRQDALCRRAEGDGGWDSGVQLGGCAHLAPG